ncbi:DUF2407 C-terminal domain-domain-containing protein [Absidia repens]|uniref:DUF2407 C-terminal domain-domain-containing protein n=1 Tax=Absidia repens TaxID=90262 RepID=A0A1X2IU31_9FUNG|nr:DUF2407 C-terminal domain-domain-containing protein [Absidia repens]
MDNTDILIYIRWTEGPDISLEVFPMFDTPSTLRDLIQQAAPHTSNKKIRLIYNGKILDNDTKRLYDYGIRTTGIFIHCVVSDHIQFDSTKTIKKKSNKIGGFDRLLESGFNNEEIRSIRTQFHRMQQTPYEDDEDLTEQLQMLEEQWMNRTGETVPEGTAQGTYKEMMWGLMLGFFLGILCIFWVRESIFTRRHQMGILAGMLLNVTFGYMHVYH